MTVVTTNAFSGPLLTNGVTKVFPFDFTAPSAAEIRAIYVDMSGVETLIPPSDYVAATNMVLGYGGSLTFYAAPPAGLSMYILLNPEFVQEVQFENDSGWLAEPHNEGYDRSALRDQALKRDTDRALKVPLDDPHPRMRSLVGGIGKVLGVVSDTDGEAIIAPVANTAVASEEAAQRAEYAATEASGKADIAMGAAQSAQELLDGFEGDTGASLIGASGGRSVQQALDAVAPAINLAVSSVSAGIDRYATVAIMNADTSKPQGRLAYVYANNGSASDPLNKVYQRSGSAWVEAPWYFDAVAGVVQPLVDEAEAAAAAAALSSVELRENLSAQQTIGPAAVISAVTSAGTGTYTFGAPIAKSGRGVKLTYYGMGTGTAYFQIVSRDDGTGANTIISEYAFAVTPGQNIVEMPSVAFVAGQYVGYRSAAGLIGLAAGAGDGFGGYWGAGTSIAVGGNYIDVTLAYADFRLKFEMSYLAVTADNFTYLQQAEPLLGGPFAVGTVLARPSATTLEAGNASAGTNTYVFEPPAPSDVALKNLRIYATVAGAAQVVAISGTPVAAAEARSVTIDLAVGLNTLNDVGLILKAGEYFGIRRGSAGIAMTTGTTDKTPYRSFTGSALTALNSSLRFEVSAEFETYGIIERTAALEGTVGKPSITHSTEGLILIWMLGESHASGRSPTFSSAIPVGRGYQFRRSTALVSHLVDPTSNEAVTTGSWGPAIGQTLLDETHGAIGAYIVNSAKGGTKVSDWATGASAWIQAQADIVAAKTAAKTAKIPISGVAINIALGTNDMYYLTTLPDFEAGMISLIGRARTEINAGADVPVILTMVPPYVNSTYDAAVLTFQQSIAKLVREQPNVFLATNASKFATEKGWFNSDKIHFNNAGNEGIGAPIATVALTRGLGLYPEGLE